MPRVCTVCNHPEREAIDRALVTGEPYRHIATRFGTSTGALQRHKAYDLPASMVKAAEAEDAAHADSLLTQVRDLQKKALAILAKAEGAGDYRTALAAIREARGNLELLAKLLGELNEAPQVNVMLSPEWVTVRATLVQALLPFGEARAALAGALLKIEGGNGQYCR